MRQDALFFSLRDRRVYGRPTITLPGAGFGNLGAREAVLRDHWSVGSAEDDYIYKTEACD